MPLARLAFAQIWHYVSSSFPRPTITDTALDFGRLLQTLDVTGTVHKRKYMNVTDRRTDGRINYSGNDVDLLKDFVYSDLYTILIRQDKVKNVQFSAENIRNFLELRNKVQRVYIRARFRRVCSAE